MHCNLIHRGGHGLTFPRKTSVKEMPGEPGRWEDMQGGECKFFSLARILKSLIVLICPSKQEGYYLHSYPEF
jgi:hypothetical protein